MPIVVVPLLIVSGHLQCFRSLAMFQVTCNVSSHLQCFKSLAMFQVTCNVSSHLQCFRSLTMFQVTYNVSGHLQFELWDLVQLGNGFRLQCVPVAFEPIGVSEVISLKFTCLLFLG